jgi:2-oxoisovalerate dehydrogenase E2 component (dihydrolipoyl transacylase)
MGLFPGPGPRSCRDEARDGELILGVHVIKIPDIGEGIAEVELVAWHVKPGDTVVEDQSLADVMTDKATVEIPSPVAGKVLSVEGTVGQLMAVGSELIRIEVEGQASVAPTPSAPTPVPPSQPSPGEGGSETPKAARVEADVTAVGKPLASPSVRRHASELGVDLAKVRGTGPAGRILHADLEAATTAPARAPQAPHAPAMPGLGRDDVENIPIIGMRRKIAQRMQEAKRHIPHFTYVEEVDVTELEALRTRLNAKKDRTRLTLLPFLMRAMVVALRDFPQINSHFDDTAGVLKRHGAVHIGIATATGAGLLVPVVRHAQDLDLWGSAAEVARVADAARNGKATREELSGSTITITSLGALGGIVSTPIINQPEVAIVGVNRMVLRPMIVGGAIVPRQMMNLSSSFDHRVVDGNVGAEFVQALRAMLEHPALLFIEGA